MKLSDLQLIHQDSVSSLYFDAELPGTYTVWHGFAASADFRAACMRGLELLREKRTYKGISDARQMRVISIIDQKWFAEEFLPLVMELEIGPMMYSAVIVPKDFFGRQSLDSIAEQIDDAISAQYQHVEVFTRYFDNDNAARDWLLNVDSDPTSVQLAGQRSDETTTSQSVA